MTRNRVIRRMSMTLAAVIVCLMSLGAAQAQTVDYTFAGKFKLTETVHWGKSVLEPGSYTIRIASQRPFLAEVTRDEDQSTIFVMCRAIEGSHLSRNALLLGKRKGELVVHSLALGDLRTTLIYEPWQTKEPVLEAHNIRSVAVLRQQSEV